MEDQLLSSLMTAYLAQIDSALKISKIISEHSGDNEGISPDALILGLIYRLMIPMEDDEMKESLKVAKKIIEESSSSEESDEDSSVVLHEDLNENNISSHEYSDCVILSKKIKPNTCNCLICATSRDCLLRFPTYESSDPLAEKFQDAIKNACEIHNLHI